MPLQELLRLVSPPDRPRHGAGDWAAAAADLGVAGLPADYRGIVERYGAGSFSDFLIVLNPFLPNAYLNLVAGGRQILASARSVRANVPDAYPLPLHPDPGGILPWAVTEAGDTLYWRTGPGSPDGWPVVLRRSSGPDVASYRLTASDFLVEWLGRRSLATTFAGEDGFPAAEFVPFRKTYLLTAFLAPSPDDFEARLGRLLRHFEARWVKSRYRGWQGFNQCSFRAGRLEVLVVYLDDAEFGSRLELHVPRAARQWAETCLAALPAAAGVPFRRPGGATADFVWAEDPGKVPAGDED